MTRYLVVEVFSLFSGKGRGVCTARGVQEVFMATLANRSMSTALARRTSSEKPHPDEVALRAYELFQKRGAQHGHDREDWFEAELQLVRERGTQRERD